MPWSSSSPLAPPGACRRAVLFLSLLSAALATAPGSRAAPLETGRSSRVARWDAVPEIVDTTGWPFADHPVAGEPLVLPLPLEIDGRAFDRAQVGEGFVLLLPVAARKAGLAGPEGGPDAEGFAPLRFDLASGAGVRLASGGAVRVARSPLGLVVRWTALEVNGATLTGEILLMPPAGVALQYLRVPEQAAAAVAHGLARAGDAKGSVLPRAATSYRLRAPVTLEPVPVEPAPLPHASGPPPAGCDPRAGTWCDDADGPASSLIFLNERFDDGLSSARGWTGTNEWHEIAYANCVPGANGGAGRAWYHGSNATCTYTSAPAGFRVGGSLLSPVFGPVTAASQFTFSSRIAYEQATAPPPDFDLAQLYVNGTLMGNMPSNLNPGLWYNFNPISLGAFAGLNVQIEFYFEADDSVSMLGWMVDDVVAWDPTVGNPGCIMNAGIGANTSCSTRSATNWKFLEGSFCAGCLYTFYVVVDCGREMHLPLSDMEGVDLAITNMVTGLPVSLHCVNDTARANAGTGPLRAFLVPDATGAGQDCDGNGPDQYWGPAFDETDNAGPGRVTWGNAQGCPIYTEYDLNGDTIADCSEVPHFGGLMDVISPGEAQIMDCSIADAAGLCGIYRVDVRSGGFGWDLFANCDGTATPQFPIYFDCTEAWAAYNPLPEFAIANLTTTSNCPATLTVGFDVLNLGCVPHPGDLLVRIESNCTPPDVKDVIVPGPFGPNEVRAIVETFDVTCAPVRIEVIADPDLTVDECTESPTVASCNAESGVDSQSTFTCGCAAQPEANAGPDLAACSGQLVTLDGFRSTMVGCAGTTFYRWLDSTGLEVRGWDTDPTHPVILGGCPAPQLYTLEVACQGEPCADSDDVLVHCFQPAADAGADVRACVGTRVVLDGSASVIDRCTQLQYRWLDAAGRQVRGWDANPQYDLGNLTCALAQDYQVEVRCATGGTCSDRDTVRVSCVEVIANGGPDAVSCENEPLLLAGSSTATGCTSVVVAWFQDTPGGPVQLTPWSTDPNLSAPGGITGCPGALSLAFVARCNDPGFETCGTADPVLVDCPKPAAPVPVATATCGVAAELRCGASEVGVTYTWDEDVATDSDGNTVPDDDADATGCDLSHAWASPGAYTARAWATEPAGGCASFADVAVEVFADPGPPAAAGMAACPGQPSSLTCGTADPALTYEWDVDVAVDSDGNTVPDDDADAATCDASHAYLEGSFTARVTATDARGCSASADVPLTIGDAAAPPEVRDDRTTRAGDSVAMSWSATAGAASYRVLRGDLHGTAASLWTLRGYDHAADDTAGRGACSVPGTSWSDPDDAAAGAPSYYYLVVGVGTCGADGPAGDARIGGATSPRDPRLPTASCP